MVDKLATEVEVINKEELLASFRQGITTAKWHWKAKDWKQIQESGFYTMLKSAVACCPPPPHSLVSVCQKAYAGSGMTRWNNSKFLKKQTFVNCLWKLLSCKQMEVERACGEGVQEYLPFLLFPSISFWLLWDNIPVWMGSVDMMWLFFHACSFSEMVIDREVKCYYICAAVVSGLIHLLVVGFGPVFVYFCVYCPAVKAFNDYQQTWLTLFDICII